MAKNVLFWIAVNSKDPYLNDKHGGFLYQDISRKSWEYWCKKNDTIFFPYETPSLDNHYDHKPTWQRWFDVFKQLDENGIDYNKICLIDSSTIIRWDTPNFIEMTSGDGITCFKAFENLRWMHEGISGYNSFFNGFNFDLTKYIACGFQIFDKNHKPFLDMLKQFYFDNYDSIMELQNDKVKRGTDQPVYNYLLQINNIKVNHDLPAPFYINHMYRFDWFSHNWQLKQDTIPFFIKYSYIWFYSGFPQRGDRYNLMKQTWDAIKDNYK